MSRPKEEIDEGEMQAETQNFTKVIWKVNFSLDDKYLGNEQDAPNYSKH